MDAPVVPRVGRLVRLGIVLPGDPARAAQLARLADLAGIDVVWVASPQMAAAVSGLLGQAAVEVLPIEERPWARTVAVSIGRTSAEAMARAELDPTFGGAGLPGQVCIVGTLEACQTAVSTLAHEGVTDLRCMLPDAPDLPDVVAQLSAIAVGTPATHRPDAHRSPDPAPPPWSSPKD